MEMTINEFGQLGISSPELDMCNAFTQLPVAIGILKGKDYILEFASDFYLRLLDDCRFQSSRTNV